MHPSNVDHGSGNAPYSLCLSQHPIATVLMYNRNAPHTTGSTDIDRIPLSFLHPILQSPFISHDANSNLIEHSDLSIEIQLRRRCRVAHVTATKGNVPRALMWETLAAPVVWREIAP